MAKAKPILPEPEVTEGLLVGHVGWWFRCDLCRRRSALFSIRKSAEESARTHAKHRCPGPDAEPGVA